MNKNLIYSSVIVVAILALLFVYMNNGMMPIDETLRVSPLPETSTSPETTILSPSTKIPPPPPIAEAPKVETDSKATPSNSTAVVTGRVTPSGASTEYWYEYGESTALGTRTATQVLGSGFISIPAPGYITGLKANVTYYFRLSAKNQYSTVNGATYSFKTNNNPPPQATVPTARTNAATEVERNSADVNGQVNPRGSLTTYWFEYDKTANFGNVTELRSVGDGNTATNVSIPLTNLRPLTKYYFRLNAQNQYGTVVGSVLSFTTKGPPAPDQPIVSTDAATNISSTSTKVNGRVNPNGAPTTYWFEYGTDALLTIIIGTESPTDSLDANDGNTKVSLEITGLKKDTKYFYRVAAQNEYGVVRGSIVTFKTKP